MTRVLLIDDDDGNRLTLSALLEGEGFDVLEAGSFAEARKLLESPPPFALVLADQQLGDGLGSELLPLVRSRLPQAKTVLMSGSAREALSAATWDGSFAKGEDFAELLQLIHGLCDVARPRDFRRVTLRSPQHATPQSQIVDFADEGVGNVSRK